jgi:hypothetical protein
MCHIACVVAQVETQPNCNICWTNNAQCPDQEICAANILILQTEGHIFGIEDSYEDYENTNTVSNDTSLDKSNSKQTRMDNIQITSEHTLPFLLADIYYG